MISIDNVVFQYYTKHMEIPCESPDECGIREAFDCRRYIVYGSVRVND
jgi:hypothetical protein